MDVLQSLLPGEHIAAFPARYHALGPYKDLLESTRRLNLPTSTFRPQTFFHENYEYLCDLFFAKYNYSVRDEHSFGRLLRPFLPDEKTIYLKSASKKVKEVNFFGHFKLNQLYWKWCDICAIEDADNYGTPYFHLVHQIPAVFHCPTHGAGLSSKCVCNHYITELREEFLPPRNNTCINCQSTIPRFSAYFDEDMAKIERLMIKLTLKGTPAKASDFVGHIQRYAGVGKRQNKSVEQYRKKQAWYNYLMGYLDERAIAVYFRGQSVGDALRGARNLLTDNRLLFERNKVPSHPLIYVIALLAANYDFPRS